jgi:cytochrome c oxidase assembly protein subunit 11
MAKHLDDEALTRKNARTGMIVFMAVIGMIGLAFASVPLYNLFCNLTGFDGRAIRAESLPDTSEILDRTVTIRFNADTNQNLQWDFRPEEREITVKIGQRGLTNYFAKNLAAAPLTGTALYNVTPLKAGKYFHKVQCFCFEAQTLDAGEQIDMPVMFYIDPAMDKDPSMKDVKTITLSYNFFKSESKELEDATEAFYNEPEN